MPAFLIPALIGAGTQITGAAINAHAAGSAAKAQANAALEEGRLKAAAAQQANGLAQTAQLASQRRLTQTGIGTTASQMQGTIKLQAPDGTTQDVPAYLAGHYLARGATRVM